VDGRGRQTHVQETVGFEKRDIGEETIKLRCATRHLTITHLMSSPVISLSNCSSSSDRYKEVQRSIGTLIRNLGTPYFFLPSDSHSCPAPPKNT
jgi:hypothetical protein